jgi:ornithine decarboxylase
VARHYHTPELVIDLDQVTQAYIEMTTVLPDVTIHYATKCNPNTQVLSLLMGLGSSFEIASAVELETLLDIGVEPAEILYSNPVKPVAHIARAFAEGVRMYSFDSLDEVKKLADAAPGSAAIVRLAANDAQSEVPSEGKFGVDAAAAVELLVEAREHGLDPYGIAFHVGSQMLHPQAWQAPLASVGRVLDELAGHGIELRMVDLGGGFPARYATPVPPLSAYASAIRDGLAGLPYRVDAVIEPGRAIVAAAGTLTATVIGTALRGGKRWIHLDVGAFNGLMESLETGNELRFPVRDSLQSAERDRFHLTGPTCDSQDTIMFDVELSADLATGDLVYIGSTGAYTTVYASTFNGFEIPAVRCVAQAVPAYRRSVAAA